MITELIGNAFKDGDASTRCVTLSRSLVKYVNEQVQRAIIWSGLSELTLFVFLVWATPIERRMGQGLYIFGGVFLFTMLLQTALYNRSKEHHYSSLILLSKLTSLIAWGGLSAWALTQFEISWTSFLVLLSTLALSSLQVVIYAPKMKLILLTNILVLLPVFVVHFFILKGLHGMAVGLLLALYSCMLFVIGKRLNIQFWMQVVERSRLRAIIDAIPGTLAWYDSNSELKGSNEKFKELFSLGDSENQPHEKYKDAEGLVSTLFSKEEANQSKGIEIGKRLQYFVAQKYNYDSEAVLMGMDLSKEQYWQESLEKERAKFISAAWTIAVGELFSLMNEAPDHVVKSVIGIVTHRDIEISFRAIFEDIRQLYKHKFDREGIEFSVQLEPGIESDLIAGSLFVALCCLIDNAREAMAHSTRKEITLIGKRVDQTMLVTVKDCGSGVDDFLTDVIFEPIFSGKEDGGNGTGLSLARDIVEAAGGNLHLVPSTEGALFEIKLPIHKAMVA